MTEQWQQFPVGGDIFTYSIDELEAYWARLHQGDKETFPAIDTLQAADAEYSILEGVPATEIHSELVQAWINYHQGEFAKATDLGLELGFAGYYVANKSTMIYASYLEEDEKTCQELFNQVSERSQAAIEAMPKHANSYYSHAFALGRFSQSISVAKALVDGMAGKIKASLDQVIELEPEHGDAHIASGLYHAEIIDKVGKMVGGMTYGAKAGKSEDHFKTALKCAPDSAISKMEYANALLMLKGDKAYDQASELYVEAAEMEPADAMEYLDIETAKAELE